MTNTKINQTLTEIELKLINFGLKYNNWLIFFFHKTKIEIRIVYDGKYRWQFDANRLKNCNNYGVK